MADHDHEPVRATSPAFLLGGAAVAILLIVVAFIVDSSFGWAVIVLFAICGAAALGYRVITSRAGSAGGTDDADSTSSVPHQEPRGERPLGDTPEAHDEVNPHDLPLDNPGREEAEELSGGPEGTTRGPLPGG